MVGQESQPPAAMEAVCLIRDPFGLLWTPVPWVSTIGSGAAVKL
jgi:hypothetical protein